MKLTYEVNKEGTKLYTNAKGQLHRLDGPAREFANGSKFWYRNSSLHRTDGPAVENYDGTKEWWLNGSLHRTDGPAVEHANGSKLWYRNSSLHREDGPAWVHASGTKEWYFEGKRLTEAEFNERTNPVVKAKLQTIEIDGVTYKLIKA